MNEQLEWLYTKLGGDERFGSITDFQQVLETDEKTATWIYDKLGGDGRFGNFNEYNTTLGLAPTFGQDLTPPPEFTAPDDVGVQAVNLHDEATKKVAEAEATPETTFQDLVRMPKDMVGTKNKVQERNVALKGALDALETSLNERFGADWNDKEYTEEEEFHLLNDPDYGAYEKLKIQAEKEGRYSRVVFADEIEREEILKDRQAQADAEYTTAIQAGNKFEANLAIRKKKFLNFVQNSTIDIQDLSAGFYRKLGFEDIAQDISERRTQNQKELEDRTRSIPSKFTGNTFEKVVDYKGEDIVVDGDGEALYGRDFVGNRVELDDAFKKEFNLSGEGKNAEFDGSWGRLWANAEQSMYDMTVNVGTALMSRNPVGLVRGIGSRVGKKIALGSIIGGTSFTQMYGDNYTQALRDYNGDVDKAALVATSKSAISAFLEVAVGGLELKLAGISPDKIKRIKDATIDAYATGAIPRKHLFKMLGEAAKDVLGENVEEFMQAVSDNAIDQLAGQDLSLLNPEEMVETALVTTFVSAPFALLGGAFNRKDNNMFHNSIYKAVKDIDALEEFYSNLPLSEKTKKVADAKLSVAKEVAAQLGELNLSEEAEFEAVPLLFQMNYLRHQDSDVGIEEATERLNRLTEELNNIAKKDFEKKPTQEETPLPDDVAVEPTEEVVTEAAEVVEEPTEQEVVEETPVVEEKPPRTEEIAAEEGGRGEPAPVLESQETPETTKTGKTAIVPIFKYDQISTEQRQKAHDNRILIERDKLLDDYRQTQRAMSPGDPESFEKFKDAQEALVEFDKETVRIEETYKEGEALASLIYEEMEQAKKDPNYENRDLLKRDPRLAALAEIKDIKEFFLTRDPDDKFSKEDIERSVTRAEQEIDLLERSLETEPTFDWGTFLQKHTELAQQNPNEEYYRDLLDNARVALETKTATEPVLRNSNYTYTNKGGKEVTQNVREIAPDQWVKVKKNGELYKGNNLITDEDSLAKIQENAEEVRTVREEGIQETGQEVGVGDLQEQFVQEEVQTEVPTETQEEIVSEDSQVVDAVNGIVDEAVVESIATKMNNNEALTDQEFAIYFANPTVIDNKVLEQKDSTDTKAEQAKINSLDDLMSLSDEDADAELLFQKEGYTKQDVLDKLTALADAGRKLNPQTLYNKLSAELGDLGITLEEVASAITAKTENLTKDQVLNQLSNTIIDISPTKFYNENKKEFKKLGITQQDIRKAFSDARGIPVPPTPAEVIQEQTNSRVRLGTVMEEVGFTPKEIQATLVVYDDVARRWARDNDSTFEEFYTKKIADVQKSTQKGLKDMDKADAKKILREVKRQAASNNPNYTPHQDEKDLRSTEEGELYFQKNKGKIRGATLFLADGSAIIFLTTASDVSTPVHELAHIFEKDLSMDQRDAVLNWTNHTTWNTDTTETFVRGFEKYLQEGRKTDNNKLQEVFDKFATWLTDLYNGLIRYKGKTIVLNNTMREIYDSMLISDSELPSKKTYKAARERVWAKFQKTGVQFKKATFQEMAQGLGSSMQKFGYKPTTISNIITKAISYGFTEPEFAVSFAEEKLLETEGGKFELVLQTHEEIGLSKAALSIQERLDSLYAVKDKNRAKGVATLELDSQISTLEDGLSKLTTVLDTQRSEDGLRLRVGAYLFKAKMFSATNLKKQFRKSAGRKLTHKEEQEIEQDASEIATIERRVKEITGNSDAEVTAQMKEVAQSVIKSMNKLPVFRELLKENKKHIKREANATAAANRIRARFNKNPNLFYQEELTEEELQEQVAEMFKDIRTLVTVTVMNDPNIVDIETLLPEVQKYEPLVSETMLLDALVWADPKIQSEEAKKLAERKALIKKEAVLIDKVRQLIDSTLKAKQANEKVKPDKIQEMEEFINSIYRLASRDIESDTEAFNEALDHLNRVSQFYTEMVFNGRIFSDLKSGDIEAMVEGLRQYQRQRGLENIPKKIAELDAIIDQLQDKNYKHDGSKLRGKIKHKYIDKELAVLRRDLAAKKRAVITKKMAHDSKSVRFWRGINEMVNVPRVFVLAADWSFIGYQGGLMLFRNLAMGKMAAIKNTMGDLFRSAFSDKGFLTTQAELKQDPYFIHALELGLRIQDPLDLKLEEELRLNTYIERLPWWTLIGPTFKVVREFSERSYISYMNRLRFEAFKEMAKNPGIKQRDLTKWVNYVNTMTGAANTFSGTESMDARINKMLDLSSMFLIAPRLYSSVFKSFGYMAGFPIEAAAALVNRKDHSKRAVHIHRMKSSMATIGSQAAVIGLIYGLGQMFGADDDDFMDPRSKRFMKLKFGQTMATVTPYASYARFLIRAWFKVAEESKLMEAPDNVNYYWKKKTFGGVVWDDFLKYRLNPIAGVINAEVFNKNWQSRQLPTGPNPLWNVVTGTTPVLDDGWWAKQKYVGKSLTPIPVQGILSNIQDGTLNKAPTEFTLDFLGINTYTVNPYSDAKVEKERERLGFRIKRYDYPQSLVKEDYDGFGKQTYRQMVQDEIGKYMQLEIANKRKLTKKGLFNESKKIQREVKQEYNSLYGD